MLDIGLKCCYLFIYTGNVLFDDEGQFLKKHEEVEHLMVVNGAR